MTYTYYSLLILQHYFYLHGIVSKMKKDTLAQKIFYILLVKVMLIFCLWKIFFAHGLSQDSRKDGISALILSNQAMVPFQAMELTHGK